MTADCTADGPLWQTDTCKTPLEPDTTTTVAAVAPTPPTTLPATGDPYTAIAVTVAVILVAVGAAVTKAARR